MEWTTRKNKQQNFTLRVLLVIFSFFALANTWYQPPLETTWQWQLEGVIETRFDVTIYDVDLYNTPQKTIDDLHNNGHKVICYYSAGTYEPDRPDSNEFPSSVLGNPVIGWPGEKWLDIRQIDILGPIMTNRTILAASKGCDGVEPDNVDGYQNPTGFPLTYQDQITYNTFISNISHAFDLGVALKNDVGQILDLVDLFDFTINEQCHEYNECDKLQPFVNQNKAVLNCEYFEDGSKPDNICPQANNQQFSSILKLLGLRAIPLYECLTESGYYDHIEFE